MLLLLCILINLILSPSLSLSLSSKAYCIEFQKVYDNEIKAFMADIKSHFSRTIDPRKGGGSPAMGGGPLSKVRVIDSADSDQVWIFYEFLKLLQNRAKVPVL